MFHDGYLNDPIDLRAKNLITCCRVAAITDAAKRGTTALDLIPCWCSTIEMPGVRCLLVKCSLDLVVCVCHCIEEEENARQLMAYKSGGQPLVPFHPPIVELPLASEGRKRFIFPNSPHGQTLCLNTVAQAVRNVGWLADDIRTFLGTKLYDTKPVVVFCGHGLGGAIAQGMAVAMRKTVEVAEVMTFGSPRVGNQAMVRCIDDVHPGGCFHFHNSCDPIVHLPKACTPALGQTYFVSCIKHDSHAFTEPPGTLARFADETWAKARRLFEQRDEMTEHSCQVYFNRLTRKLKKLSS
jgi:hypothetical protein